jgi:hypothetical protein
VQYGKAKVARRICEMHSRDARTDFDRRKCACSFGN